MDRVVPNPQHPAKWSQPILDLIGRLVAEEERRLGRRLRVCDPMAGIGRTHDLDADTVTGELEIEWAACRRPSVVADAAAPPFRQASFDLICTSPCYGNRYSDSHRNRDRHKACGGEGCRGCNGSGLSPRKSYTHVLGHRPRPGSTGTMRFGPTYQAAHERIYATFAGLLRPGGLALVNVSDFVRDKQVVQAVDWHRRALLAVGLVLDCMYAVPTKRMRRGANYEARVPFEHVIVMRSPA